MKGGNKGSASNVVFYSLCLVAGLIYGRLAAVYHLPMPPLVWFIAGLAIGIAFHEAGHVLCALVARMPILLVSIGGGPLLLSGRLGGAKLEWRLLPFFGFVQCYPAFAYRKLSQAIFVLGGVLGNVTLVAIVAGLDFVGAVPPAARAPLTGIVIAQFLLILISLLPFTTSVGGTRIGTDGLQLLRLLWRPRNGSTEVARFYASQLARYSRSGEPGPGASLASPRIFYQTRRLDAWSDEAVRSEVQDALSRELELGELGREDEMLLLDTLLTLGLVTGDEKFRPWLDEWSLRALKLGPEIATLVGTRGAVLVSLGRFQEGKALLSSLSVAQHDASFDATFDTLMTQFFLARAEYGLGNAAAARALGVAARRTAEAIRADSPGVAVLTARFERDLPPQS
jgi:hypothetical protein